MSSGVLNPWETLETFQSTQFDRLYRNPSSAQAIFRNRIPELARSIVMTMLYVPRPIAKSDLEMFVSPGSSRTYNQALLNLEQYHILKPITLGGVESYFLTHEFAKSLRQTLTNTKSNESCCQAMKLSTFAPIAPDELDRYSAGRIDDVLNFIINPAVITMNGFQHASSLPRRIIDLVEKGGLVTYNGADKSVEQVRLSGPGFSFVTENLDTQIWALIFLYISNTSNAGTNGSDIVETLSFVFLVTSLEPGTAYSTINLSQKQLSTLEVLSDLGVVLLNRRANSSIISSYVPTRVAALLTGGIDAKSIEQKSALHPLLSSIPQPAEGFIIVDADFDVVAYPSSLLQSVLLSLFIESDSFQPTKVLGKINRSSIQRAISHGISAKQITSFLNACAHPKMRAAARQQQNRTGSRTATVPSNVAEQISTWELEWNHANFATGLLVGTIKSCLKCETSCKCASTAMKSPLVKFAVDTHLQPSVGTVQST